MLSKDNIQFIYPPLKKQRALGFYSLQSRSFDPGFIQLRCSIKGPLDKVKFERAWQILIERHESMRLSLQSPKNKSSMIVVVKSCELPVEWVDIQNMDLQSQQDYIRDRLNTLQNNGLELSRPPVHYLLGVQTHNETIEFFWSCHHVFLDGWSAVVLLKDLAQIYSSELEERDLPLPPQSTQRDYIKWLDGQDKRGAMEFWDSVFSGYREPAYFSDCLDLKEEKSNVHLKKYDQLDFYSDTELSIQIDRIALELQVTHASILYAVWAIYLAALTDKDDVVFGTTSAGRSFDLPDSQSMTGYFANVVPKRFILDWSRSLADLISQSHQVAFSTLMHEYVALDEIQSRTAIPASKLLFDHLILFENVPLSDIALENTDSVATMSSFSGNQTSTYPLTLTIQPGDKWRFRYLYSSLLDCEQLYSILEQFPDFLTKILKDIESPIRNACPTVSRANGRRCEEQVCSNSSDNSPYNSYAGDESDLPVTRENAISYMLQKLQENPTQLARTSTETTISAIWEELLGIESIDVNTEFISLGGRSILAVKMLALIEGRFNKKLSMLDLVTTPTIAGLARLVDGDVEKSTWHSLIPLKSSGSKPPVIFIHAVGSHALFMRSITPYFDKDQPVLGMQLTGLDGECAPMSSIHEVADHYLKELLHYQPVGPYFLVSHCYGAVVAHEMVHRLKELGKEISLFVVLDARPPLKKPEKTSTQVMFEVIKDTGDSTFFKHYYLIIIRILGHLRHKFQITLYKIKRQYFRKFGTTFQKKQAYAEQVHDAIHLGFNKYIGRSIDEEITLIRCENQLVPMHMDWQHMTIDLNVVKLPVGHNTMFTEPEVGVLGSCISQLVKNAS